VGSRLLPEPRERGWRPFDDRVAADLEARRLLPNAAQRLVFRIGDDGDQTPL